MKKCNYIIVFNIKRNKKKGVKEKEREKLRKRGPEDNNKSSVKY